MNHRAVVKQEYQVILRTADGKEHTWPISDCYFERKLETIGQKMLDVIRKEDLTHQFSLETENPHHSDCPWHGVDLDNDDHCDQMDDTPCLCAKKYRVTLVHIETNETKDWTGTASDRYDAVGQTFMAITGKTQGDNLDEWKVLQAQELS